MKSYHFDHLPYQEQLVRLFRELESAEKLSVTELQQIVRQYSKDTGYFAKDELLQAYLVLAGTNGLQPKQTKILRWLKLKPVRTISGVTPITVLTKPFPCPGKCIFCPNDIRMPKSYLSDEPGAQRAERNWFDPYLQTTNRLQALANIGHSVDKAELIILGGTWSYYPEAYQIWFIKECFRALNDFGDGVSQTEDIQERYQRMQATLQKKGDFAASDDPRDNKQLTETLQIKGSELHKSYNQVISELYVAPERKAGFDEYQKASWDELEREQTRNEAAKVKNVGLVIETRPDNISEAEVLRIRRLGCTKAQIGVQSLQDEVLSMNHRGHDVAATRRAFALLRQAGFKIHAHWMANLHGSSVEKDKTDFESLFTDPDFCPDELKVYPCSLIDSAELMAYHQRGEWQPYTHQELLSVVTHALAVTPPYCRLTRIVRDIPSTDIVVGNKFTNFRQIAEAELLKQDRVSHDIRAREVRGQVVDVARAEFSIVRYQTTVSQELFLQYTSEQKLLAFLRLSLPTQQSFVAELHDAAMIRELHVYGEVVGFGQDQSQKAQHQGFGTKLLEEAKQLASQAGFQKIAVISAIGTREYYRKRGFSDGELYQFAHI